MATIKSHLESPPHSQQEDKQSPPNQNQKVNIIQFKLNQKKEKEKKKNDE